MRNRDFAVLAKQLLPALPGFVAKTPFMFVAPVKQTLLGLCFESHSYEARLFYVWVFFQLLAVRAAHASFTLGKRIEGPERGPWDADAPDLVTQLGAALRREALPFLSRIKSPLDVAEAAGALRRENPYVQQTIGYALARAGDVARAVPALDELIRALDLRSPWQREIAERADLLKATLLSDAADAQRMLDVWEDETVRNLGLEGFRESRL
jgi:hypothetical protein